MTAKQNEKTNGKSQISGWNLAGQKFKGVKAILSLFKSLSALKDQILLVLWSYLVRLELPHHFQCRVPTQEQLTFRSLAEEMFIFLATFGEVPALFQDFDAFIFMNSSRHVEPLNDSPLFHTYPPFWCRYANPIQTEVRFASLKAVSWTNFFSFSFDMLTRSPPNPKHPLTAVDQANLRR